GYTPGAIRYVARSGTFTGQASTCASRGIRRDRDVSAATACEDRLVVFDASSLGADERPLTPPECAAVAARAAALVGGAALDRESDGAATPLWRNAVSEAWLNTWWERRDSGFHDHDGSCGGVFVLEGSVRGESLIVGGPRRVVTYGAGESFSFE